MRSLRLALFTLLLFAMPALAEPPVFQTDGVAIRGYDPVAYFVGGQPTAGSPDITAEYAGATWRFATTENRALFLLDPVKYAPQYGGYCAYGMTVGQKVPIDPDAWSIVDGKLYLNNSMKVHELWSVDPAGNIETADSKWPSVKDQ
jgi:hypothetical protein